MRIGRVACAVSIALACVVGLTACNDLNSSSSSIKVEGLTGGVAAKVNGIEIQEDTITTDIEKYRASAGLTNKDDWGQWLVDYSYTPESVREEMIDSYVGKELIIQAAKENNIEVPSSEIDEYVNKTKSYYDTTTAWDEALEAAGITEEEYRDSIEQALLEQKVQEQIVQADEPSEEEMLESAQTYATYYNGAKRSSHILFEAGDDKTAQEVLTKVNSGELDFAEAAKQYSKDSATAEKGGDVGWDKMTSFVTEYTEALNALQKDQTSALVTSEYGIHIIKCTDVFTAPETVTSLDQIPEEFVTAIKSSLESSKKSEAYSSWYEEYKGKAQIEINDMPENVPYNVDVTQYTATDSSFNETDLLEGSSSESTGDESANTSEGTEATSEEQPAEAA